MTETANERVTDNGKPSGIATTTTVIPIIIYWSNFAISLEVSHGYLVVFIIANLISKTMTIIIADIRPNLPISLAIIYNFCCKGVS